MMTEEQIRERIKVIDEAIERYQKMYDIRDADEDYQLFKKRVGIPNCHCGASHLKVAKYNLQVVLGESE